MSFQKEFLQIQEGRIADVTFLFPTGLKKDGNFGPYFLYTVKHEEKEKFLKVTERLEKELRKMNIKTKQVYSLFKETIHPPKGEPYTLLRIVEGKNPEPVQIPAPQQPAAVQPQTAKVQDVNFTGDKQVMHQSILDAVDITKAIGGVEWRNTDIEKIGVTLFLSRTGQLTIEQVLSNGNSKKPRKVKEVQKAEPSRELVSADAVPSNGNGKHDDLPF
jgi:hypothetical protein